MTAISEQGADRSAEVELVTGTIDGNAVSVPKGTMIIRAAELLGIEIPRFCDHPLLEPVAACRQCLIEVEGMPKPQPSCAIPLGDGMDVKTQFTSDVAETAQKGVVEFLLTNHPLDCPVCDKGGECPLQNQAMSAGRPDSRYRLPKLTFPKPVNISAQILLDQERCVNCARCTRFADQIAGDPLIDLLDRGANQHPGVGDEPFDSYFSGNTIQICPVGALTSAGYRFRSRPFDLMSVPTTCEHCASGCSLRTDIRSGEVMRRYAWDDPDVNEQWNCDKGRFAFVYLNEDRITGPLVRENGELRAASWPEALRIVAGGLSGAIGRAAVLTGGRLTLEDAYAYSRFARVALKTDNIDFRVRVSSDEEIEFLGSEVAGTSGPTYRNLADAPAVLLVGLEPEDESPILFLKLRKAARAGTRVSSVAAFASEGLTKMNGNLIATVPGSEAEALSDLASDVVTELEKDGSVILVGERMAGAPGALAAAAELAERTGSALAWVPRRAGERGALDSGCLPGLLPGGRPLTDFTARQEVASAWGIAPNDLPPHPGLATEGITALVMKDFDAVESVAEDAEPPSERTELSGASAALPSEGTHGLSPEPDSPSDGTGSRDEGDQDTVPRIGAIVVAGVEAADEADPDGFLAAIRQAPFVVSLETRSSAVTAEADVVLPVGVVTEKGGSFVNWEGRRRPFAPAVVSASSFTDAQVLALLSDYMDLEPAPRDLVELRAEIAEIGAWSGERAAITPPESAPGDPSPPMPQTAVLASWRMLLDLGVMQKGEAHLAATRREPVARVSEATASRVGVREGESLRISTERGGIGLPVVVTEMPDDVVWVPFNSPNSRVSATLGVAAGDSVRLSQMQDVVPVKDGESDA